MRYLEFCKCGAGVPARYPREKVGCSADRRSCGKPVELTQCEILDRDRELQLESLLRWQAAGVNIDAGRGQVLEHTGSRLEFRT